MRKTTLVTNFLLAVVAAGLTSSYPMMFAQTSQPSTDDNRSRATQVFLSNAQLDPNENYQVIRAFVKTGTLNPNCLVTLGDTILSSMAPSYFVRRGNPPTWAKA